MGEAEKRKHIEQARNFNGKGSFENHVLRFLCMQIGLLADISETLLDMQKGAEHGRTKGED